MATELEIAVEAAREAGKLLRQKYQEPHDIQEKSAGNLVTEMDHRCEQLIATMLLDAFPNDGFFGEEKNHNRLNKKRQWIVDPLDGTNNYAHGYPLFCVSIALAEGTNPVVGAIYNPLLDEMFSAELGKGTTKNGLPVHTSGVTELNDAILTSGFPYGVWHRDDDNMTEFRRLVKKTISVHNDCCAGLDLCHTACGRIEGYWEREIEPWDIAAGSLLVSEAGGKVCLADGRPFDLFGRSLLATNAYLQEKVLAAMRGES